MTETMKPQKGLEAKLLTSSQAFSASEIEKFALGLRIINHGENTVDPATHQYELLVNGKPSKSFALAIGNGKREDKWFALPPGDSVEMTWKTMGPGLFPAAGEYTLQLKTPFGDAVPVELKIE